MVEEGFSLERVVAECGYTGGRVVTLAQVMCVWWESGYTGGRVVTLARVMCVCWKSVVILVEE